MTIHVDPITIQIAPQDKLDQIILMLKEIKMDDATLKALLDKIDGTTNKLASNIQLIADVDQKISNEIDAFIASHPAGTTITDAEIAQLQATADKAQATSDASDAQVSVLQAIAAKGSVAVPPPPPPPVLPPA